METKSAAEHLQVIRTLMERSALYRRALAPIMLYNGLLGVGGSIAGWVMKIEHTRPFLLLWAAIALCALLGSFLLVRRQSLKDSEPLWTPPARRVMAAIVPPLLFGSILGINFFLLAPGNSVIQGYLPPLWMALYGCALHSAGFFMPRGIRLLGWLFVLLACGNMFLYFSHIWEIARSTLERPLSTGHLQMGLSFGLLHLAYGAYLYSTEKRKNAA